MDKGQKIKYTYGGQPNLPVGTIGEVLDVWPDGVLLCQFPVPNPCAGRFWMAPYEVEPIND